MHFFVSMTVADKFAFIRNFMILRGKTNSLHIEVDG